VYLLKTKKIPFICHLIPVLFKTKDSRFKFNLPGSLNEQLYNKKKALIVHVLVNMYCICLFYTVPKPLNSKARKPECVTECVSLGS